MAESLRIVLFSGGRGTASIAEVLLQRSQVFLTVLVNTYDDGLSTGRLRRFIPGMLGPSDVRKNIARMMRSDERSGKALRFLLEYRIPESFAFEEGLKLLEHIREGLTLQALPDVAAALDELTVRQTRTLRAFCDAFFGYCTRRAGEGDRFDFADCAIGNLLFSGCFLKNHGAFNVAVSELSALADISGRVLNVTDGENLVLVGLKEDGTLLSCEADIVARQSPSRLAEIFLLPHYLSGEEARWLVGRPAAEVAAALARRHRTPRINPEVREALTTADVIIYGPGTQHSSLLPSYLTDGVAEAISSNMSAEKVFISNILKDHEIVSETANSLTDKLVYYLNRQGALAFGWADLITTCFFQFVHADGSPDYVRFDENSFPVPRQNVVLTNWEASPGKHSGWRVADELISIANLKLQGKVRPFHHMVSIVVPGLNEERTVRRVLHDLTLLDLHALGLSKEVLYVDGGSTDDSLAQARSVPGVKVMSLSGEEGRGAALRLGIARAAGDVIVFFPSDGEYRTADIKTLVMAIVREGFPVVFGSRAIRCMNISERIMQIYRGDRVGYLISKYGGILLSVMSLLLYNRYVADPLTGVKAFDTELLRALALRCRGVDLDLEIVAKMGRKGSYILEVPVEYMPRTKREGKKTTVWDGLKALWTLIEHRLRTTGEKSVDSHPRV